MTTGQFLKRLHEEGLMITKEGIRYHREHNGIGRKVKDDYDQDRFDYTEEDLEKIRPYIGRPGRRPKGWKPGA